MRMFVKIVAKLKNFNCDNLKTQITKKKKIRRKNLFQNQKMKLLINPYTFDKKKKPY